MEISERRQIATEALVPYEGAEPYVFISYAHADAEAVLAVAAQLQAAGFRIWYDAGIEVGSEWPEYIAAHLKGAAVMLAFLSNSYVRSDNCRAEMHYALTKKIPSVNIFLERTDMTPGLEMQLGHRFALMKYEMSDALFWEKLIAAPPLVSLLPDGGGKRPFRPAAEAARKARRPLWKRILIWFLVLALLGGLTAVGIVGWSTGLAQRLYIRQSLPTPESLPGTTEIVFTDPALEKAARSYCGKAEGSVLVSDLTGLTELRLEEAKDLSDLAFFPDLRQLTLAAPELDSLETLPVCALETLRLEGCPVTDLTGVGNLPLLRELETADCPLRSLGDLSRCIQLRRLALDGADVADFSPVKPLTKLAEAEISNCGINELRPLMRLSSLTDVRFVNCDLRGDFFYAFDREKRIVSLSLVDCELNSTANMDDFRGLTTLTLIRSGAILDWSVLNKLPVLHTVTVDESMVRAVGEGLKESDVELTVTEG